MEFTASNPLATVEYGRKLGELLLPGDFIALVGELGSGKTQFAKGVALGVGVPENEPVCSPSYSILNIHQGRFPLYHFDMYRLTDSFRVAELGFEEFFEGEGVCLVEWAELLGDQIPHDTLKIIFSVDGPEQRLLHFQTAGDRSNELLRLLSSALMQKSV